MTPDGVIIKFEHLGDDLVACELYLLDHDIPTWSWFPSVHSGEIDLTVIAAQIAAHHA